MSDEKVPPPLVFSFAAHVGEPGTVIRGSIFDSRDRSVRLVVELLLDGTPIQVARADQYDPDLHRSGIGDGCYGFSFVFATSLLAEGAWAEVRVANSTACVGGAWLQSNVTGPQEPVAPGLVSWNGGRRLTGWTSEDPPLIRAFIGGACVAEKWADDWTEVSFGAASRPCRGFSITLPEAVADGCLRVVEVRAASGDELLGSPLKVLAFPSRLADFLAQNTPGLDEQVRAKLIDQLIPSAVPFVEYRGWSERFPAPIAPDTTATLAVLLVGAADPDRTLASLHDQTEVTWTAAWLPEEGTAFSFDPEHLAAFLSSDARDAETVVIVRAGSRLHKGALAALADALQSSSAELAYCDVALEQDGHAWPLCFSAFDLERAIEQGMGSFCFAMTQEAALSAARANVASAVATLLFAVSRTGPIAHVPWVLIDVPAPDVAAETAALRDAVQATLGLHADVAQGQLLPAVRLRREPQARKVSIIVPTRNRADLLERCIASIRPACVGLDYEILIADNDSTDPITLEWLGAAAASPGTRVVRIPGTFNFARICNAAAAEASGEVLLFLNNDVEAIDNEWLVEMLGRLEAANVGAVGPVLTWPSGIVQHGGIVLGPYGGAEHAFTDRMGEDPGYGDLLRVAHEVSAVTGACLMTPAALFQSLEGFDENVFPVNFNDVDYCLKVRASGNRVVLTPHARLLHRASSTRSHRGTDQEHRYLRELASLRAKWGKVIADDPMYHPSLNRDLRPYSGLSWPPGPRHPRLAVWPQPDVIPPGF